MSIPHSRAEGAPRAGLLSRAQGPVCSRDLAKLWGAEPLRQAQLWQESSALRDLSLPSFNSSVRADQLEREPLPARASDCPPSRRGEEAEPTFGHQAQWLYRAAGWQSVPYPCSTHLLRTFSLSANPDKEVPPGPSVKHLPLPTASQR